jgi:hypothetical protein
MFGERYFAARERLASVMSGIAALAAETGTELAGPAALGTLADGLGPPFLFIVCGEVNAGKSALFNGLFGHDLCAVSQLPETRQVTWYRYGEVAREVAVLPLLEECYRPLSWLRDFHLIDTPGINSAVTGHLEITERFLPVAALVMFVLPVSNPWGAATWNVISRLPAEVLDRVVLVIQQCDRVNPADIGVILGHMRDLSVKRLGRPLPTFAVSAKLAFEARQSVPVDASRLAVSGILTLEEHISRQVCDAPDRQAMLETWREQAAAALRAVDDRLENQGRTIRFQSGFLEDEERNITGMRERFIARLPSHLSGVAEVFQRECVWVGALLRKRLGALRSVYRLFAGDATSHAMETAFIERLQATVEEVAEKDGAELVAACRDHWNELAERAFTAMGVRLGDAVRLDETLLAVRNRFVKRLGQAAREGIGNLKVRNQLGNDLARRNLSLKSFTFVTLVLLTIGATCGALGLALVPEILVGLALLFALAGWLIAQLTRRVVVADFQDRLLDTCGGFAAALRTDYEEALRIVFQDYGETLGAIRRHLVVAKGTLEPRQKRWNELFLTLKALEQDMLDNRRAERW